MATVQTNTAMGNESQRRKGLGYMASTVMHSVSTSEVKLVTVPAVPLTSKHSGSMSKSGYMKIVGNTKLSEGLGHDCALQVLV